MYLSVTSILKLYLNPLCLCKKFSSSHLTDIVHRDLKLENILVKNSLDEDADGRINIKVSWSHKL